MKILNSIAKLVNAWFDYSARMRTIAELSQLSDRQLDDIGLARHELNMKMAELWIQDSNTATPKADTDKAALVDAVKPPAKEKGLGMQLVSLYSAWNRPDYIV